MNSSALAKKVSALYGEAVQCWQTMAGQDRSIQAQDAEAGQTIVFSPVISDDDLRQRAEAEVYAKRDAALQAVQSERESAQRELSNAPTNQEANYIMAISTRDDLTEAEVTAGLERYRSHAAQHAISAAAKRSGLTAFCVDTDAERYLRNLDQAERQICKLFIPADVMAVSNAQLLVNSTVLEAAVRGDEEDIFTLLSRQQ